MKYRVITAAAVLITWVVIYFLDLTDNALVFLVPLSILALFQVGEKNISKYFNRN